MDKNNLIIKEIFDEEYFEQIIIELRKEYGIQRRGDTYMSEERLQNIYCKLKNKELDSVGIFNNKKLLAFMSYAITYDGLYASDILIFEGYRRNGLGSMLLEYLQNYAKENNCKQIYFGARRSANDFYYKHGFEGTCLIQSSVATKNDIQNILQKYGICDFEYNLYQNFVHQFRVDEKFMNNQELLNELDNSALDIGCIVTFCKKMIKQ